MKKILFIFIIVTSCSNPYRRSNNISNNTICDITGKISKYQDLYEQDVVNNNNLFDSIVLLNNLLITKTLNSLKQKDKLCFVKNNIILKEFVLEKNIKLLNWNIFSSSIDEINTSLLFRKNGNKNLSNKFNFSIDTIIKIKQNTSYIMIGSRKCGNVCITKTAYCFSIVDGNLLFKNFYSILKNNVCDKLVFNYNINFQIDNDLDFKLDGKKIFCPKLDTINHSKLIGFDEFVILEE